MQLLRFCLLATCVLSGLAAKVASPAKFLIISAPRQGKITYKRILAGGRMSNETAKVLTTAGLAHPQGLAIHTKSSKLLVADPDTKQILSYTLRSSGDTLTATPAGTVMDKVEARWVAVDGLGNVFATDEPSNKILKVSAAQLAKGEVTPEVLYDGLSLTSVSGPGGIAVDNFYTYWVNKQIGTQAGSLVRGAVKPDQFLSTSTKASLLEAMTRNTDKSYGLCTAMSNIYYTQPDNTIFAVKKTGGAVAKITDKLSKPRGCAWDGDGTVYVADRGANAVFSFPANQDQLGTSLMEKATDAEDAFGVAVFDSSSRCAVLIALMVSLLQLQW